MATDDNEDTRLPTESGPQRIGKEAVQAFTAAHPTSWNVQPLEGTDDYGFDKHVQVVDTHGRVAGAFYVQIKGSEDIKIDNSGTRFSVSLKMTTLNYYARTPNPIMLVFADLTADADPRNCPVYWTWITEDIRGLLKGKPDFASFSQETMTFHVPATQRLDRSLDVTPALRRFRRRASALNRFYQSVSEVEETPVEAINTVAAVVQERGKPLMATLLSRQESPWLEPPQGSVAAVLKDAHTRITLNDDIRAEQLLRRISGRIGNSTALEKAEYEFLEGKICLLRNDVENSLAHYANAVAHNPESPRYQAALLEAKFIGTPLDDKNSLGELLRSIPQTDDEIVVCVKARILAASGKIKPALRLLSGLDGARADVARAMITYLARDWPTVIEVCDDGLRRDTINEADAILLHVLKARACFYESVGPAALDADSVMPLFGTPTMDFARARQAWDEVAVIFELLKRNNWPPVAEHVLDVTTFLAAALGRLKEILPHLEALAVRRPELVAANDAVHRVAVLCDDKDSALRAMNRMAENDESLHFSILLLHDIGRHTDVLDLAEKGLLSADRGNRLHGPALANAALSAHAVLAPDRAKPFEDALHEDPSLSGDAAVYDFVFASNETPLRRDSALKALVTAYDRLPKSTLIQDNLFTALDARNPDLATRCVEIAARIQQRRRLAVREIRHLAQALVTLQKWPELEVLADQATKQYGPIATLLSIKAVARDGAGDAAGALEILENIVSGSDADDVAIDNYVIICMVNGFHQAALRQLDALFQRAQSSDDRKTYLHQMFGVQMAVDPRSQRLFEIAWRYGQVCDKEAEEEEGVFLQMFLTSTLSETTKVRDDQVKEFHDRAEKFFKRFPDSEIIKRFQLPETADAATLKAALTEALGLDAKTQKWFERVENQLNHGELPAPFVWRPRRLLKNISDVVYLWAIAKTSNKDKRAYQLVISADPEYAGADLKRGLDRPPLLDVTTLLVLHDLQLLDLAFRILGRVAIGKHTLLHIQHLSHPLLGGYTPMVAISEFLRKNIDKIQQPRFPTDNAEGSNKLDEGLDELKALAATGRFTMYIDDLYARQYVDLGQTATPAITTIDLLIEAERRELLTTQQVADKLAQLIEWRVAVPVKSKYFLASLPDGLEAISDVGKLVDMLRSHAPYARMTDGLWDIRIDYQRTFKHIAAHLAQIARSHRARVELLAAVWETWLIKIRLRTDSSFTQLGHLANSLVRSAVLVKDDSAAIKRLWDAYVLVVTRIYGERMEERTERAARQVAGTATARIANQQEDPAVRDALVAAMRAGLNPGTADLAAFDEAYVQERARLANEKSE